MSNVPGGRARPDSAARGGALLSGEGRRDPEVVDEAVFRVLEACPAGRVVAYGTVAAWLGLSNARRAAAAMRRAPEGIPWWRHVRTDGGLIPELLGCARRHWEDEGTPYGARGVREAAFWHPDSREWSTLRDRIAQLEAIDAGETDAGEMGADEMGADETDARGTAGNVTAASEATEEPRC
ncbi:MGMT family protein [Pseudoglutamicibacter albus]|uniref:Alkylated DNA nucleotide flippase Atl1 n=1 Tax=Pseudoglutamicibacter albus TaxID=98671 RepID=A0ABU1Z1P8_9MICC|nr:MGMT family protein [Pseudoglutamicibacter albus]MDR7293926.1 alkylated DNA nucleotide flippase Atl1 [Pseudoglutamicibacter albus]